MSKVSPDTIKEFNNSEAELRDKEGNKISHDEWNEKIHSDYRFHLISYIGPYTISTRWFGLVEIDGSYWVTLVLKEHKECPEKELVSVERHHSKEESEKFHQKMIDEYAHIGFK